ncbi:MAG TPA: anthranilate phosphoribosyltransferase [Methylocella sp.]|nr:anthranilate phosphoribosyltransferase [Methylocella sp.]
MDAFKPLIAKVAAGSSLTGPEAEAAFGLIFAGHATPAQLGGFLMALRARGETVDEITGAVRALRERMLRVLAPPGAIDIVGTGGDGHGTLNVSTLAALITAACGVPVAKHGNRSASSKSGSSDVLSALGVGLELTPREVESCLEEAGIGFMAAPVHHQSMRHAAQVRAELGTRTIFNLIGPLANPAGVKYQLLGVFAQGWLEPLAQVLRNLGSRRVWLVHGSDGLDEATTTGPSFVTALEDGEIRSFQITPEDAGLPRASLGDLAGGDQFANAAALRAVLQGVKNPYRDIAVLNAALALVVAGKAQDLRDGATLAAAAIDEGLAAETLTKLVKVSNRPSPHPNGLVAKAAGDVR